MHLIQQHTFDIHCSSQEFGKELQNQLRLLLEKEFYPQLEQLLNKYEIKNHIWSIDLLDIKLPNLSKKYWKQELIQKSLSQIEEYLIRNSFSAEFHQDRIDSTVLVAKSNQAATLFFHFLETGGFIENSISKDIEAIVLEIKIDKPFIDKLIAIFKSNPMQIVRWIFSVPNSFKRNLFKKTKDISNEIVVLLYDILEETNKIEEENSRKSIQKIAQNSILKKQWIELIQWLIYLEKKGASKDLLIKEFILLSDKYWDIELQDLKNIGQYVSKKTDKPEGIHNAIAVFFKAIENPFKNKNNSLEDEIINGTILPLENRSTVNREKNAIQYITNGGLVLLHPFLKSLFEQLNLCDQNGKWKSKISQQKAILLTQYLIYGSMRIQECDLILNKILCGYSLTAIVNVKLKISKNEKQKCLRLLEAVKAHWKVMNDSSVEALQQTFLQREAKLELSKGNNYELWIEEKGVDILLEQLPWGIAMIQTPWMENYLNCYWT